MKIKAKLILGLALLFAMIVLLGVFSVYNIQRLSSDSRNILVNNYNSLTYARKMLDALNHIQNDSTLIHSFMANMELQQNNITELNEGNLTERLRDDFEQFRNNQSEENVRQLRLDLNEIMGLNMASINHKAEIAENTSQQALLWISIIGVVCIAVALISLLYFPRSITKPIKALIDGIVEISNRNYKKRLNFNSSGEFGEVSRSFNNMAESLSEYRQSTLEDLLVSKKYIEAIVNSITEPIIGLNRERTVLFANEEALTVLNLKKENIIGRSADEVALKNDLLRRLIRELIQPNDKNEPLKIYADNKESYFKVQYIPIKVQNEDKSALQNIGDLILLKNITEFKELDSAKTTFISTISHELKTPISAIMMSLKLLQDNRIGELNDEQKHLSESIKENSDRLLNITGELLKLTQVETGKLQLNPKITKPVELINYAINATRVLAEKFGCHIEVEYPEKMGKLFVDSEKIAWVITNLLSNAIHYSKENARIIVGAKQTANRIDIFVQDFGKGIDPRYHQSIFDRYFRVPGTKVQGSGLGLSISKDFVEAQNGTISIESEVGKGSKFTISFVIN